MKEAICRKVEEWNQQQKPQRKSDNMLDEDLIRTPPPKIDVEYDNSTTQLDKDDIASEGEGSSCESLEGEEVFTRKIHSWNRHYGSFRSKGERPQIKPKQKHKMDIDTVDLDVDEQENYEVNISDMVGGWDKHYRPSSSRDDSEQQSPQMKDVGLRRTQSLRVKSNVKDLTNKVGLWEKHFRPNKYKSKTSTEKKESEETEVKEEEIKVKKPVKRSVTLLARPEMTGLVDLWNKHFRPQRRCKVAANPEVKQKRQLKAVTSLLVKQWDDHYDKLQQDNEHSTPTTDIKLRNSERTIPKQLFYSGSEYNADKKDSYRSRRTISQLSLSSSESITPHASDDESDDRTPTNSDDERLSSDESEASEGQLKKTGSSLSRTPSLVRARIRELGNQRTRVVAKQSHSRKTTDFAELRSKFVISC